MAVEAADKEAKRLAKEQAKILAGKIKDHQKALDRLRNHCAKVLPETASRDKVRGYVALTISQADAEALAWGALQAVQAPANGAASLEAPGEA